MSHRDQESVESDAGTEPISAWTSPPAEADDPPLDEQGRRLIDAAIDCTHRLGYGRVSTAEVALMAGVSANEQYERFATKADLMAAVGAEVVRRWGAEQRRQQSEMTIDLTADERSQWIGVVRRCTARSVNPERHVWQELVLAAVTDAPLRTLLEPIIEGVSHLAWRDLSGLPNAHRVPADVLVGAAATLTQMSDLEATMIDLYDTAIPGLTRSMELLVGALHDTYVAPDTTVDVAAASRRERSEVSPDG